MSSMFGWLRVSRIAATAHRSWPIRSTIFTFVCLCLVMQATASAQTITEFAVPTTNSFPWGITAGPDGALWFTEQQDATGRIGRITVTGAITEFGDPGVYGGITTGPDGALWFVRRYPDLIGRITSLGDITDYFPLREGSRPQAITVGPDGALWFTEYGTSKIGRITTDGIITEFGIPTGNALPIGITAGPDGALWFTENHACKIGRVTTAGAFTEFPLQGTADACAGGITVGPDDAIWFEISSRAIIGRITTDGSITQFQLPNLDSQPDLITNGSDGALWFSDPVRNSLGRITVDGVYTEFPIPTPNSGPRWITTGPDGALWFTEYSGNKIARLALSQYVGTPGDSFCIGQSVAALSKRYGGLKTAATALGFSNTKAVQDAIRAYCGGSGPALAINP
jgi:virginiamycin B lyase